MKVEFYGWTITFNPKPHPNRRYDWDYVHEDYDGENGMYGSASSISACIAEIQGGGGVPAPDMHEGRQGGSGVTVLAPQP